MYQYLNQVIVLGRMTANILIITIILSRFAANLPAGQPDDNFDGLAEGSL